MVEFVLAALRATPRIGRIGLVGPDPLPPAVAARVDVAVGERGTLLDNVAAGLEALDIEARDAEKMVLTAAADIPLLTVRAVDAFLDAAETIEADIWYAAVPHEEITRAFPEARKTSVRLRDGTFTGGSLMLIRPRAFSLARPMIEQAVRARKRPWALARLFGLATLAGLATGRLTIADLERRVARITGCRVRAVICRCPEIAIDVDRPETLAVVEGRLARPADPAVVDPAVFRGIRAR